MNMSFLFSKKDRKNKPVFPWVVPDPSAVDHPVFEHAQNQEKKELLEYIEFGISPLHSDEQGTTLLMKLCQTGPLEALQTLLDRNPKTNLNIPDQKGWTPLTTAASHKNLPLVQHLIERGCDVTVCNSEQNSVLHILARLDSSGFHPIKNSPNPSLSNPLFELIEKIISESPNLIDTTNIFGETPLLNAVSRGQVETVQLLMRYNPNLSIKNGKQQDALEVAHQLGNKKIAEIIEERLTTGKNIKLDTDNLTAISKINQGNLNPVSLVGIIEEVQKQGNHVAWKLLHFAITSLNLRMIDFLLLRCGFSSAQVNQVDENGNNAFLLACSMGDHEIVMRLLKVSGVMVYAVNNNRETCLHLLAEFNGNTDPTLIYILENFEPCVDFYNSKHQTPLLLAILNRKEIFAKLLIGVGACVVKEDFNKLNSLSAAAQMGFLELAKVMAQIAPQQEIQLEDSLLIPELSVFIENFNNNAKRNFAQSKIQTRLYRYEFIFTTKLRIFCQFHRSFAENELGIQLPKVIKPKTIDPQIPYSDILQILGALADLYHLHHTFLLTLKLPTTTFTKEYHTLMNEAVPLYGVILRQRTYTKSWNYLCKTKEKVETYRKLGLTFDFHELIRQHVLCLSEHFLALSENLPGEQPALLVLEDMGFFLLHFIHQEKVSQSSEKKGSFFEWIKSFSSESQRGALFKSNNNSPSNSTLREKKTSSQEHLGDSAEFRMRSRAASSADEFLYKIPLFPFAGNKSHKNKDPVLGSSQEGK